MHWVLSEIFLVASFGAWGARHFYKFKLRQFWKVAELLHKMLVWRLCSIFADDATSESCPKRSGFKISKILVLPSEKQSDYICQISHTVDAAYINISIYAYINISIQGSSHSPFTERLKGCKLVTKAFLAILQFWIPPELHFKHFNIWSISFAQSTKHF